MTIQFDRPVGATADIKELEYLSALHQTCMPDLRQDASIDGEKNKMAESKRRRRAACVDACSYIAHGASYPPSFLLLQPAKDISNLLLSRHGLLVDIELIKKGVLIELAGEFDDQDPLYKMDLCQVVAILLIPHLLKNDITGQELEKVLAVLRDPFESVSPKLNREFLKETLEIHGEINVRDAVLDEMISAAGGEGTTLDASSLLKAVTSDVSHYKIEWADRLSTHFQDAWKGNELDCANDSTGDEESACIDEDGQEHPTLDEETLATTTVGCFTKRGAQNPPVRKLFTAPAIDNTADTYRNQSYAVLLWASMILVYLAYFYDFDLRWGEADCGHLSEFACKLVNGITSWLVIFVELSFFGTAYICLGSAGNSLSDNRWVAVGRLLVGMTTILFATILPLSYVVVTPVFSTEKQDGFDAAYISTAFVGSILIVMQLLSLIGEFVSLDFLKKYQCWENILAPGMEKMERHTKRAARRKVQIMVDNALVYHCLVPGMPSSMSQGLKMTAGGIAGINYEMRGEKMERAGGIWWGWKRVFNGSIFEEEGIWLHSSLVSSTVTQFFICIFLIVFLAISVVQVLESVNSGQANPEDSTSEPFVYPWE